MKPNLRQERKGFKGLLVQYPYPQKTDQERFEFSWWFYIQFVIFLVRVTAVSSLLCFDPLGWAIGMASGLQKISVTYFLQVALAQHDVLPK